MEKKIKAYCVIPTKPYAKKVNRFWKEIKVDLMGSNKNPYLSIHPLDKRGLQHAEGHCNGYEQVAECEITIKKPKKHICNCNYCHL